MEKPVFLVVCMFIFPFTALSQVDSTGLAGADTIILSEYDEYGKLTETTTWIGVEFRLSEDALMLQESGEKPTKWDTLEAFDLSGQVYTREYKADGKLKSETKTVKGEDEYLRYYYYGDSLYFGYSEYRYPESGPVSTKEHVYEFYPDSTPRIIGYREKFKTHGRYQTFYDNGMRQCDCYYYYGDRDSLQKIYHRSGEIWQLLVYDKGRLMEVLEVNGPDGKPLEKGSLENGNDTLLIYTGEGKLEKTMYFKKGKFKREVNVE